MRRMRYLLVLRFLLALITLMPGWGVKKAWAAPDKKSPVQEETKTEVSKKGCDPEDSGGECPATFGPIITDTAVPIDKGKFAIQPTFAFNFLTSVFNRNWHPVSAGGNFRSFQTYWKFTYGLMNNLEVYAIIPYIHKWAYNVDTPGPGGERSANYGGLGDIDLTVKYRLVEEGPGKPTVTALFATDFPTGNFRYLNPRRLLTDQIGGGTYVFTTGLNVSKWLDPFLLYGNFWYSMSTAFTVNETRVYPRDFVTVNLAAEYPITKKWVALLELTSFWDGGRLIGHKSNVPPQALVSVLPAIEYIATEKVMFALGVNVDFMGKTYPANVTPVLSILYQF